MLVERCALFEVSGDLPLPSTDLDENSRSNHVPGCGQTMFCSPISHIATELPVLLFTLEPQRRHSGRNRCPYLVRSLVFNVIRGMLCPVNRPDTFLSPA